MSKKIFFSKVLEMTVAMVVFNISNLCYNIFISNRLGAETTGLFHLVGAVYSIGISICVSGMSLTVTRLLSDMPRQKGLECSDSIVGKCLKISLVTSLFATFLMQGLSGYIARVFLGKDGAEKYIKTLSLCLTAVSVSSVLGGYFTAFGKVGAMCAGRIMSEMTSWLCTFAFLKSSDDECMAIVKATMLSAFAECASDVFFWRMSRKNQIRKKSDVTYAQVVRLCAPLALGSYLRTGLGSAENMLMPKRLSLFSSGSLAKYGVLKGMTMPVLYFPSVLTSAFVSLLVPEIARRFSQRCKKSVEYVSKLSLESIIKFGVLVSFIFLVWSPEISERIFKRADAGEYMRLLSFLPLFMYVDSVTDAILKGINEQVFSLKINTVDACLRVVLVIFALPVFGIKAYIAILYISEILNLSMSFWRLKKTTALRFSFGRAALVAMISPVCGLLVVYLLKPQNLASQILTFTAIYFGISEVLTVILKRKHS